MLVTELPIVTAVNQLQFQKAQPPMLVTEFGIVTDDSPVNPRKKRFGITLTLLPIVKVVIFESPENGPPTVPQLS